MVDAQPSHRLAAAVMSGSALSVRLAGSREPHHVLVLPPLTNCRRLCSRG